MPRTASCGVNAAPPERQRADADAEAAVAVVEDRRVDDRARAPVVVELAVAGPRAAVAQRSVARDAVGAARVAAVGRDEDLVAAAVSLERVRAHEDLVGEPAGEPRPVAVVAEARALVPRLPAVDRREDRVVGKVDAGVVDAAAGVLREIGIAEPGVGRVLRTRRPEVAVAVPVDAAVGRGPGVDLVAVVRDECEVAPRRARDPVAVKMRRPLVRRVDEPAVQRIREHLRLAAGELLVDVHGRREPGRGRARRARAGKRNRDRGDRERARHRPQSPADQEFPPFILTPLDGVLPRSGEIEASGSSRPVRSLSA